MWRASIAQKQKLYLALWCGCIRVGNHTVSNAYHHCGKVEVEAFGCWLVSQKVRRQTKTVLLITKYLNGATLRGMLSPPYRR